MHCQSCGAPGYGHISKVAPFVCSACKGRKRDEAERNARQAAAAVAATVPKTVVMRDLRDYALYRSIGELFAQLREIARVSPDFSENTWNALGVAVDALARNGLGEAAPLPVAPQPPTGVAEAVTAMAEMKAAEMKAGNGVHPAPTITPEHDHTTAPLPPDAPVK